VAQLCGDPDPYVGTRLSVPFRSTCRPLNRPRWPLRLQNSAVSAQRGSQSRTIASAMNASVSSFIVQVFKAAPTGWQSDYHRKDTKDKPFSCDACEASFARKSVLCCFLPASRQLAESQFLRDTLIRHSRLHMNGAASVSTPSSSESGSRLPSSLPGLSPPDPAPLLTQEALGPDLHDNSLFISAQSDSLDRPGTRWLCRSEAAANDTQSFVQSH
jgi:hypothetical protein